MKPKDYIKDKPLAMEYFNAIADILKKRGMDDDAYSIELSRLANECYKYEDCQVKAKVREDEGLGGFWNEYDNGTIQVNALHTISKDASATIDKLIAKFGLTPSDFSKIKDMVKEKKKASALDSLTVSTT